MSNQITVLEELFRLLDPDDVYEFDGNPLFEWQYHQKEDRPIVRVQLERNNKVLVMISYYKKPTRFLELTGKEVTLG